MPISLEGGGRAHEDHWVRRFQSSGRAGKDAYAALTRVYALFGHSTESIPFTTGEEISEEVVAAL